jgi:hypothetical protein
VDQIDFGGTDSSETTSLIPPQYKDMILKVTNSMIENIKTTCLSINECRNNMDHWKKREFESALKVGECLVTLRSTNPDIDSRFKKFVETEFVNEFCYRTAKRYMKLYTEKSELSPEVRTIRQAYLSLGILKEEYSDTVDEMESDNDCIPSVTLGSTLGSNTVNTTNPTNTPGQKNISLPKTKTISIKKLQEYYSESILTTLENNGEDHFVRLHYFMGDFRAKIVGSHFYFLLDEKNEKIVLQHLEPYVYWYNATKAKHEKSKITQFPPNCVSNVDKAA